MQLQAQQPDTGSLSNSKAVFESMPGMHVLLKLDAPKYTILAVSNDHLFVTGFTREQIIGKGLFEAFTPNPADADSDGQQNLVTSFEYVIQNRTQHQLPVQRYDIKNTHGVFQESYWAATNSPVLDDAGSVIYIIHSSANITAEVTARQKEDKLKDIERSFNLFMQAPVTIAIVKGDDYVIELANESMQKVWGRGKEVIGKPLLTAIPELEGQGFIEKLDEVRRTGSPYYAYESPATLIHDGKQQNFYFDFVYQPYYEDDDNTIAAGIIGVAHDVTEQVLAKKKTEESEQLFRTLANSIPQLSWMADADGSVFWYNDKWYEYTGTDAEQMKGWGWQNVHHPAKLPEVLHQWKASIQNGEPFEMVFPIKGANGDFRQFLTRVLPVVNSDGKIHRWFGTNTDITDQINAETELKKIKGQLELTFQNVPSAIYHFDKSGAIVYLNELGAKQLGYDSADQLLAEKDINRLAKRLDETYIVLRQDGSPLPVAESSVALCFRTGKPSEVISQFIHRETRKTFWLLSKSSPLFDEKGELSTVLTTSTDITLQKTSEHTIHQSESRFRTLAETLPQMIWVRNMEGQIEYGSKNWEDYSGIKDVSEAWKAMTHPSDWEPIMNVWRTALETGASFKYEARLKNKHGEYKWHSAVGEPVFDETGKVIKFIGALTDIHEQKTFAEKLEKLVEERTRELQRSNEDLQQFAHVASHDLKEPVRKVLTFGNRLKQELSGQLSENAHFYLSRIESSAIRMYSMIDGVLLYSSLTALEQTKELIDLNELVENIEEDLEVPIAQKKGTLVYENLPQLEGSSILLHQLFYNLINNSLKFSKPDVPPVIELSHKIADRTTLESLHLDGGGEFIEIMLRDNGIGFSNIDKEKIFGAFTRLHAKDKYEGTGLGLALCKKIVERHGGAIFTDGVEGIGATFHVLFPKV